MAKCEDRKVNLLPLKVIWFGLQRTERERELETRERREASKEIRRVTQRPLQREKNSSYSNIYERSTWRSLLSFLIMKFKHTVLKIKKI